LKSSAATFSFVKLRVLCGFESEINPPIGLLPLEPSTGKVKIACSVAAKLAEQHAMRTPKFESESGVGRVGA